MSLASSGSSRVCVVTGGAGFIGSHLVERLLTDGWQVRVIDNHSTGRAQNLDHLRNNPNLTETVADIATADLRSVLDGAERVFHLAALADIVPSIQNPVAYYEANVHGTMRLMEAARAAGINRLVYTASSSCYGIPDVYPTPETATIQPQYPYALTKYLGEQIALHWGQVYRIPVISLRLFNVYGPRSRTSGTYGAVFGVFLRQKLAGEPFTVVGDGNQTRDFTFVTDVVEAFVRAGESGIAGEILNVGSGGTYSVNQLVGLLGGPVVHIPKRPGEPDSTFADIACIREKLGWAPEVSLENGVKQVLACIDYWGQAPLWTPDTIAEATKDWFRFLS